MSTPIPSPKLLRLQFSIDQNAWHFILAAPIAAYGCFLSYSFAFDVSYLEPRTGGARLTPLLQSAGGVPGVAFGAMIFAFFGWWAYRAGWRFLTNRSAVELVGDHLRLHPSFLRPTTIRLSEITQVEVFQEAKGVVSIFSLRLRWVDADDNSLVTRSAKIRSNTIDGGRESAENFANQLRALLEQDAS